MSARVQGLVFFVVEVDSWIVEPLPFAYMLESARVSLPAERHLSIAGLLIFLGVAEEADLALV